MTPCIGGRHCIMNNVDNKIIIIIIIDLFGSLGQDRVLQIDFSFYFDFSVFET